LEQCQPAAPAHHSKAVESEAMKALILGRSWYQRWLRFDSRGS